MKKDINLIECLQWERDHGFLSAAECTRLIEQDGPPATVMVLQESQPTSYGKDPGPPRAPDGIEWFSTGLNLNDYLKYKGQKPASRHPAAPATERSPKTLTEVDLIEARTQLFNAAGGEPVAKLPPGIHERLYNAIKG